MNLKHLRFFFSLTCVKKNLIWKRLLWDYTNPIFRNLGQSNLG